MFRRRIGSVGRVAMTPAQQLEHIRNRVRTNEQGCWLWMMACSPMGYGFVSWQGRPRLVHRVVYENLKGPIPEGLQLDHLCRQPACCNPKHLEPVTNRENTLRGLRPNRSGKCPQGHEVTEETGYWTKPTKSRPNSTLRCRVCRNQSAIRSRRAQREEHTRAAKAQRSVLNAQ